MNPSEPNQTLQTSPAQVQDIPSVSQQAPTPNVASVPYIRYDALQNVGKVDASTRNYVTIALCFWLGSFMASFALKGASYSSIIFGICGLATIVAVVWIYIYTKKLAAINAQALALFLRQNNWQLDGADQTAHIATSLLGAGHGQRFHAAFSGTYFGLEMHAAIYEFKTGQGKNEETHVFTNLHFVLPKVFPLIVLDDKQNNAWFQSDLPDRISGGRDLELEGDFGKRFKLTVLPNTEQEVLQLVTPDFMNELMQSNTVADIELQGNNLFIITSSSYAYTIKTLSQLFGTANVVLHHIHEASDTWQASSSASEITSMNQTAMSARAAAMASLKNQTLAKQAGWVIAAIAVIVFILMML